MRTLVAYVPVLHEGYRRFFESAESPKELLIMGPELIAEFPQLKKEIRQLEPHTAKKMVDALGIFARVLVAAPGDLSGKTDVLLPDEDVSHALARKYLAGAVISYSPVFLRWDRHAALAERPVVPEERITREAFHAEVMRELSLEAKKSSDIWRHVAAAVARDGAVVMKAHNRHLPTEHAPYLNGDPRNNFSKGEFIEYSTAMHAEAAIIAKAARDGVALEGADFYVTVFPCPPCAKLIAESGVRTLYCEGGYSVLDGQEILQSAGVRVMFVEA